MRIALLHYSYSPKAFSENLSPVDEEFCLAPPIILAYVAGILERSGHKVMLLDARALGLSKEQALEKIRNFSPHMLGFRSETYHFHDALEWVSYLKTRLRIPVFTGGVNMDLYPKETLSHDEIDYGIVGEAIEALPLFLRALENGDELSGLPALAYKDKDGYIRINPAPIKQVDFDSYPHPARHLLPNEKYYSFISQRRNFTIMLTSTGCPFKCTFCAIPSSYRFRSPGSVIEEVQSCYRDYNIREIDFFDAVLFMPRPRIMEILRRLKNLKLDLEWSCRARVDLTDDEMLKAASEAGCRQIYYGIESVEQDVLNRINKNIAPEKIVRAISLSKKYGIRAMGFFMIGNSGDTVESVRNTIRFAKRLDLDFIQVCRAIAKPGTQLDKEMIKSTGIDFWREHVLGNKIEERLPSPWTGLSERQKAALTKEFYLKFYFRPTIIFRRLRQLKSLVEFFRYLRVGLKVFAHKSELYSSFVTNTADAQCYLNQSSSFLAQAQNKRVAVVMPTYNEKENISGMIAEVKKVLPQAHLVIVDDESVDGTAEAVRRAAQDFTGIHLISRKGKKGLGLAYREGFRYVLSELDADYIFEMDADFSHNPRYLPVFLHYAEFYDLVTGSRFLNKVSIKNRKIWRNVISKSAKWFVNMLIGMDLTDVTTGYKCFKRDALKRIRLDGLQSRGYAFQVEGSFAIKRSGGRIKEIPILFVERSRGRSKMSLNIMLEAAWLIMKLSLKRLKG